MALSPILVNAGSMGGMNSQNSAFNLMGKALTDMESRKNSRNATARAASDRILKSAEEDTTRNIISSTKQNTFYDDFQDRFDTEMSSMYNPDGSVIAGQEERAKIFSDGGFGDSINPNELSHMARLSAGVNDPGKYSNDIYDQMIAAGLSPAQAEAQRKTQKAKWTPAEMTKGALQAQKIKSDQILKDKELFNKNALELFKTKESTGGYTDAAGNFVSSKSSNKDRFKDALKTKAEFSSAFGFDPTSDIAGNIGGDQAFGVYTSFLNQGYSPAQMREAISNTSAEEFFGTDAEGNATSKEDYTAVVQNYLDTGKMKAGAKPGDSTSGKYGSGSYSGIKDSAGFQKYLNKGNADFDSRTNALLNTGKPGKQAVLDSVFDWYDEPKKEKSDKPGEKNKPGGKKDSVFTDGRTNEEILKSPLAKPGSIVDPANVEVPNDDLFQQGEQMIKDATEKKLKREERNRGGLTKQEDKILKRLKNSKRQDLDSVKREILKLENKKMGVLDSKSNELPSLPGWMTSISPAGGKGQTPGSSGYVNPQKKRDIQTTRDANIKKVQGRERLKSVFPNVSNEALDSFNELRAQGGNEQYSDAELMELIQNSLSGKILK